MQAWYNQFLQVDPTNPDHVYAGLEEVFETHDAGSHLGTLGPYWNFGFPCWSIDPSKQTGDCHQTHARRPALGRGRQLPRASRTSYVGNDGGVYRRPLHGSADAAGHATDWASLNDGTIDILQYYSVGVGKRPHRRRRRHRRPAGQRPVRPAPGRPA